MVEVNPFDAVVEVDVGAITGQIHGKCGWDIRWKSYVAHKWILWIEPLDKKNCVNKEWERNPIGSRWYYWDSGEIAT